jgi:hypothetical protein
MTPILFWLLIINNCFDCFIAFTTENDITFKLNKKRVGSIEQAPTFKSA